MTATLFSHNFSGDPLKYLAHFFNLLKFWQFIADVLGSLHIFNMSSQVAPDYGYSSDEDLSNLDESHRQLKVMKSSSPPRQLAVMLKISFLRKFRAPTIWMELGLPLLFFVFVCLFTSKITLKSKPLENTTADQIIPYAAIPGPSPHYGMIPDNKNTRELLNKIQKYTIAPQGSINITGDFIFFKDFDEYKQWISQNRKIDDHFYAIEWVNSNETNATTNPDFRLSSNGMTVGSVPDFVRTVVAAAADVHKLPTQTTSNVYYDFAKMPMPSVNTVDSDYYLKSIIFCAVLFISPIITAGTNYGAGGLRDLFVYFGLSPSVNRLRFYIECFTVNFVCSIPFALVIWGILKINVGLLILTFFLSSGAFTSFTFFLVSLHPTQTMGRIVGLGVLLSVFVFVFWASFTWMHTEGGYYEKRIFSIFPQAALQYTLGQIVAGYCLGFDQINQPPGYKVSMGLIYLACETVVYYLLFVLVDSCMSWKWFPAPIKWGYKKPKSDDISPIVVQGLVKQYGKDTYAVNDVSFEVPLGETLAIVGPNGAGKSTLIGLLSGSKEPTLGDIQYCGTSIRKYLKTAHHLIGLCPQDNLFMNELTAAEWIETVAVLRGEPDFDYSEIFRALGLDKQLRSRIGDMSGGNKRKVCLASALVANPPIVILDEATSGVDFTSRTRIWSLISGLKNTTVIMATHTLEECEKIADRIMVLSDGQIADLATPNELRQKFKCGYLIETEDHNADRLQKALTAHNFTEPVEVSDRNASVVLPADTPNMSNILRDLDFTYLLTIQSLEEKIFSRIQAKEMAELLKKNRDEDSDLDKGTGDETISSQGLSTDSTASAASIDQVESKDSSDSTSDYSSSSSP